MGPLASSPVMLGNAGAGACAYGAGAVPMALPQLQQLVDAARMELQGSASSAQSQASSAAALGGAVRPGGSGGGAVGPAVAALVNALEDVFSSPGATEKGGEGRKGSGRQPWQGCGMSTGCVSCGLLVVTCPPAVSRCC